MNMHFKLNFRMLAKLFNGLINRMSPQIVFTMLFYSVFPLFPSMFASASKKKLNNEMELNKNLQGHKLWRSLWLSNRTLQQSMMLVTLYLPQFVTASPLRGSSSVVALKAISRCTCTSATSNCLGYSINVTRAWTVYLFHFHFSCK